MHIHGTWNPDSSFANTLGGFGAISIVVSFVSGGIGAIREKPPGYGVVAMCLSACSFLIYVR
jgi:hypothetical protein